MRATSVRVMLTVFMCALFSQACVNEKVQGIVRAPLENESLESYLNNQGFSGAVYIAEDGNVFLNKGFGYSDKGQSVKNIPDTKFRIGSLTKQFTSAAILTLIEKGYLSLNDYVSEHIPSFPHGDKVTIKHLLTHTSGLPNYTALPEYKYVLSQSKTPQQILAMFASLPLEFTPGSQFSYSNSGYIVLGVIIENLTGIAYRDYVHTYIFELVQMQDSGYAKNESSDASEAEGLMPDGSPAPDLDMSLPYSAGGLSSTVNDLTKWDTALYNHNLLSEQTTDLMFTPFLDGYALGWHITTLAKTSEVVYAHSGGVAGFSSVIMRFPESKKVIIVLSNFDGYPVTELAVHLNSLLADKY